MKKIKTVYANTKRALFDKKGQIRLLKSYLPKGIKRFYQFLVQKGS